MALFDESRHEALTETPWRESAARAAIERIAADAHAAFSEEGLWPIHPIDRSPERADTLKPIYYGAAGVVWTLLQLQRAGMADIGRDYVPAVASLLERHRADSQRLTGAPILAYPTGDAGIALLHWTMAPSRAIADELYRVIEANAAHPSLGFGWGGPGSMLAALFMFERTREQRFQSCTCRSSKRSGNAGNTTPRSVVTCGPRTCTAFARNASAACMAWPERVSCMLRGRELLSADRRDELERRAIAALSGTACVTKRARWRTGRWRPMRRTAPAFCGCSIASARPAS